MILLKLFLFYLNAGLITCLSTIALLDSAILIQFNEKHNALNPPPTNLNLTSEFFRDELKLWDELTFDILKTHSCLHCEIACIVLLVFVGNISFTKTLK